MLHEARKLTPCQRRTTWSQKPQSVTPSRGCAPGDRQQEHCRYLGKSLSRSSYARLKAASMRKDGFWNFLSRPFYPEAVARWLVVIGCGGRRGGVDPRNCLSGFLSPVTCNSDFLLETSSLGGWPAREICVCCSFRCGRADVCYGRKLMMFDLFGRLLILLLRFVLLAFPMSAQREGHFTCIHSIKGESPWSLVLCFLEKENVLFKAGYMYSGKLKCFVR